MRFALDPAGHRVPRTKPTCLLHTWRPHRRRPFALVLHLHQYQSSCNLHLQYLAKNQSTQHCQSLITPGSDHPPVLEPHMVLTYFNARGLPYECVFDTLLFSLSYRPVGKSVSHHVVTHPTFSSFSFLDHHTGHLARHDAQTLLYECILDAL
jgi:hypothetical protein